MRMLNSFSAGALSLSIALSVFAALPAEVRAQAPGSPTVSVVTLQVLPGQGGGEQVVTPRGMVVPLPGAGVNGNVVQIYIGSQGGYWYVDRYGQTVDLTAAVQQFRAMSGQAPPQTAQPPQDAPQPSVQVVNEQPQSSGGGGGVGSSLMTATAAGLGAMAGSALTNNSYWNNVPYGTPLYYGQGAHPYYRGPQGNNVNIDSNRTVNASANVNENQIHANNLQKQQEWYNQQARSGSEQFKNWQNQTENPFVRSDAGPMANTGAGGSGRSGRRGRFGGGGGAADAGGRDFGGGGAGDAGGRDLGGGGAGDAGGRFRNRGDGGGGGGGLRRRGR